MKILFLAAKLDRFGGIEKYNRTFIATLREFKQDVIVVERPLGGFFAKASFLVYVIFSVLWYRPDFIVCAHLNFSLICYWLYKILRINYSVSVYGIEVANIKSAAKKHALANATHVIYLFEATASRVVQQIPSVQSKLFKVPNSVDGSTFYIKQKSKSLTSRFGLFDSKIVATIGRMSKLDGDNKGYRRVIEAMSEVIKEVPDVKYFLVGNGDDVAGVKELVRERSLTQSVIVVDAPSNAELVDYYNLADVFVMPSKNEGFPPIVILEALSCGVPVIVGNQLGAKELIKDRFGLVVPSDDVRSIGVAIVKMLKREVVPQIFNKGAVRKTTIEMFGGDVYRERVRQFVESIRIQ